MTPLVSVVVPTVIGRELLLSRCLDAYERTAPGCKLIVVRDQPACGKAWARGLDEADGPYVHFSADDLIPHDGWLEAARAVCEAGLLPAPRILNGDGTLQSCGVPDHETPDGSPAAFSRIPFLARDQLDLVLPLYEGHYYTDVYVSERARQAGIETVVARGYLFTHHFAREGRIDTPLEVERDAVTRLLSAHGPVINSEVF